MEVEKLHRLWSSDRPEVHTRHIDILNFVFHLKSGGKNIYNSLFLFICLFCFLILNTFIVKGSVTDTMDSLRGHLGLPLYNKVTVCEC